MNPLDQMERSKSSFTHNDMKIYQVIEKEPSLIVHLTTTELASRCGVSQPALTRFVRQIGYHKYSDFRMDIITWLTLENQSEEDASSTQLDYFVRFSKMIAEAEKLLTKEYLQELAAYLSKFDHIYCSGISKSYLSAKLLEILYRKLDRYISAVTPDCLSDSVSYMTENDLLILFSVSAKPDLLKTAVGNRCKVMLVTTEQNTKFINKLDKLVVLPYVGSDPEWASISPVLFDIFIELLVSFSAMRTPESDNTI